jgi:TolB protein
LPHLQIHTSIRNEAAALAATLAVTAFVLAVLLAVIFLGDQRRFEVVLASPGEGQSVPITLHSVTLTFSAEADRSAVEQRLRIEPEAPGTIRWRGRSLEYVFAEPLIPGPYRLTLDPGTLGRGAQQMQSHFSLGFEARQPGVLVATREDGVHRLIAFREGSEPRELISGEHIRDFAIAPDGRTIAVITAAEDQPTRLTLIDSGTGVPTVILDSSDIDVGSVAWSSDSNALLAIRRDRLPSGDQGVPRIWLLRLSGEFVAPLDPGGSPTRAASWSPDSQFIAYVVPTSAQLLVKNLSTDETTDLGEPRGGLPAWSPNSRLLVFDGVPPTALTLGTSPVQPVRVKSIDGEIDRSFGLPGEMRSSPRFLDDDTIISLRRQVGDRAPGTELLFESVSTGRIVRSVLLAPGTDVVTSWDLDPAHTAIVYTVAFGATRAVFTLDLESGKRTPLPIGGEQARWLP